MQVEVLASNYSHLNGLCTDSYQTVFPGLTWLYKWFVKSLSLICVLALISFKFVVFRWTFSIIILDFDLIHCHISLVMRMPALC